MKIRKFKRGDEKELSLMIQKAIKGLRKYYPNSKISAWCNRYKPWRIRLRSLARFIYVVTSRKKIIGTATYFRNRVFAVFVSPEYQRKGIGTKIMKLIEKEEKEKGMKILRLQASIPAVKFYMKLGYNMYNKRVMKRTKGVYYWMEKEL